MNGSSGIGSGGTGTILICRNKHFPYIASYHGPWLSLPHELFQSLIDINGSTKPHPIDATVFRNLFAIRKLVDEAAELAIRAVSSIQGSGFMGSHHNQHHHHANGFGRVSHMRQNRLRELAVAKLAQAYRIDEIATSVLAMQSASALDDIASKVLKKNSRHIDALYVHFFHEKIPSRMLAESTTTAVLDEIIEGQPGVPAYYRTRAMIHGFREEYSLALKDFKTAISLVRRRQQHALKNTAEDACCESQLVFLRGACYHQYALSLMERAIQGVNKKHGYSSNKGTASPGAKPSRNEIPFAAIDYNPEFCTDYIAALDKCSSQVTQLARKSVRDYCSFLSSYPEGLPSFVHPAGGEALASESPPLIPVKASDTHIANVDTLPDFVKNLPSRTALSTLMADGSVGHVDSKHGCCPGCLQDLPENLDKASTYHPLLVEAWFVIGINYLILGEWQTALQWHERIMQMHTLIEGYPIFLPARSMGQADYLEVLRKLRGLFRSQASPDVKEKPSQPALIVGPDGGPDGAHGEIEGVMALKEKAPTSVVKKETRKEVGGSGGSGTNLKQYPLYTQRTDTVLVWLRRGVMGRLKHVREGSASVA
ncbi:hypothetical protein HDU67_007211 [Dinochytrium kinnereticum]|nr:hypothetical protein HDU67_007211 [Dinochytrium kinnereticum]